MLRTGRDSSTWTRSSRASALFVTCLVDLFRPSVGFAAVKLLEDAGCTVEVPAAQTCCGQPAFNSGDRADAAGDRARSVIDAFEGYDYVVAPSGSCAGMIASTIPSCSPTSRRPCRGADDLAGAHPRAGLASSPT